MKITIETTIPTGQQFENIKTSYSADIHDLDTDLTRQKMILYAKQDIEKLSNYKQQRETVRLPECTKEIVISGVTWYRVGDKWEFKSV